jgi:glycine dehydrogenase
MKMVLARNALVLKRRIGASLPLTPLRPSYPTRSLASVRPTKSLFDPLDTFSERHIGPDDHEVSLMLSKLGYDSMDAFVDASMPPQIRVSANAVCNTSIPPLSESELLLRAKELGRQNRPTKSYIGMGYHNAVVPPVILRNVRHLVRYTRVSEPDGPSGH